MPIGSMTGFARSQGDVSGPPATVWTWEARSVNSKALDVRLRLPAGFDSLEAGARDAVMRRFKRGSVSLSLTAARTDDQPAIRLNEALLAQLVDIVGVWRERVGERVAPPTMDGLLAVKGVLEPVQETEDEGAARARDAAMMDGLARTLDALAAMRAEEGARLAVVLNGQLDAIAELVRRAANSASARPEAIRERLRAQVAALLDASPLLPEERLAQEAALLAAKADVREELDRLNAHVEAARTLLAEGGPVGRKLDFLCQEFNREANTLCSKSSSIDLTRIGLDLKAAIDQMREQVQNIE
ncbi:MAG: YicC family protein [Alphaproteobacteria bacterium]|nr:YicC family protein [Alphaproteobacteria bacterium]MBF0130101.1 YicC family protein [Alphaproteobacteria bacterium]